MIAVWLCRFFREFDEASHVPGAAIGIISIARWGGKILMCAIIFVVARVTGHARRRGDYLLRSSRARASCLRGSAAGPKVARAAVASWASVRSICLDFSMPITAG